METNTLEEEMTRIAFKDMPQFLQNRGQSKEVVNLFSKVADKIEPLTEKEIRYMENQTLKVMQKNFIPFEDKSDSDIHALMQTPKTDLFSKL